MVDVAGVAVEAQCAWCLKLQTPEGEWVESPGYKINGSHGVCPDCLVKLEAELAELEMAGAE